MSSDFAVLSAISLKIILLRKEVSSLNLHHVLEMFFFSLPFWNYFLGKSSSYFPLNKIFVIKVKILMLSNISVKYLRYFHFLNNIIFYLFLIEKLIWFPQVAPRPQQSSLRSLPECLTQSPVRRIYGQRTTHALAFNNPPQPLWGRKSSSLGGQGQAERPVSCCSGVAFRAPLWHRRCRFWFGCSFKAFWPGAMSGVSGSLPHWLKHWHKLGPVPGLERVQK